MEILNQGINGQCANFSYMWALMRMNPLFDWKECFKKMNGNFLTHEKASRWFTSQWYIKNTQQIERSQISGLLLKWIPIICSSSVANFSNASRSPFKITFDWKDQHFWIMEGRKGNIITCVNSWGENWWDHGRFYMENTEENFRKLFTPRILII